MHKKAIVIGGGPLGISAATKLLEEGYIVTIIEKSSTLLGLASTFQYRNQSIEKFYHFFYKNDSDQAIKLLNKYTDQEVNVRWCDISTDSYIDGARYNFDSFFSITKLVKFDIFKIIFAILKIKLFKLDSRLDNVSAVKWAEETFGIAFSHFVWIPLLKQKFGNKYKEISALWLATRIARHMSTKSNSSGKSRFGYLIDTYTPFVDKFEKKIVDNGGRILFNTNIHEIQISENQIINIKTDNEVIDTAKCTVFSTISLSEIKKIKGLTKDFDYLSKFENIGVVTVVLFLNKQLSNHYWTTVTDENIPFFAVLQQNRLYAKTSEEIVYLSQYCLQDNKLLKLSNDDIYNQWIQSLKKIYPSLNDSNILDYQVFRSNVAAPIPFKGIMQSLPHYKTPCSNFYHAGFEHICPEDRGVGNSIKVGVELVEEYLCTIK